MILTALVAAAICQPQPKLPEVAVTRDDTVLSESCRVKIDPQTFIADANGNGVIQIGADNITVEFTAGSLLRGASAETPADEFTGTGIRLQKRKGVTLRGLAVSGFKVGVWTSECDGLTIERSDLSGNYRQRLKSSPAAEDGADWLFPHNNDDHEWATNHGAGLCVERSAGVTVHDVTIRRGQNGIILDRVADSRVYDNDCSFLSGWGLALWRSSRNTISRNAFDFCVRGYSHKVYNRGQDSAGILMFEQCSGNTIAENSVTHGGDGIFGFAGREAIGEKPTPGLDLTRRGNNDNLIIGNDLSYAPAHGLEMTFSFGNQVILNKFVENAICGIWGGYSQDTVIARNTFEGNGEMAYGLERGGINIEHGAGNLVIGNNTFKNNKCGIHLWWNNNEAFLKGAWGKPNVRGVTGNVIAGNVFEGDELVLHLRDDGSGNVHDNLFVSNRLVKVGKDIDAKPGTEPLTKGQVPKFQMPRYEAFGRKKPVGARPKLKGRENIIMTEWGPWDHESPLARLVASAGDRHVYEVFGAGPDLKAVAEPAAAQVTVVPGADGGPAKVTVAAPPGVTPYTLSLTGKGLNETVKGTIIATKWTVRFFPWTVDPRQDKDGWLAESRLPEAVETQTDTLRFNFGHGGPKDLGLEALKDAGPGPDHFGTQAWAKVPLSRGVWRITTLSDDGVRIRVNGDVVIDNWTWHAPAKDTGEFTMNEDGEAFIDAEHFEIDGFSVLTLDLEKVK